MWGKRLLATLNAPQCKPGNWRTHPDSNGDARQTLTPTTRSTVEKATLSVSRSTACPLPHDAFPRIYTETRTECNESVSKVHRLDQSAITPQLSANGRLPEQPPGRQSSQLLINLDYAHWPWWELFRLRTGLFLSYSEGRGRHPSPSSSETNESPS